MAMMIYHETRKNSFESLSNELLLDIFEYLSTTYLIHAFHGLNFQFNSLLSHHFIIHGLDFRPMYLIHFDTICQTYLPNVFDKIPSLYASGMESSFQMLNRLNSHGYTIGQFIQLKSLKLICIFSKQMMNEMLLALPHLTQLTHLTVDSCEWPESECSESSTALPFIDCIWTLPKLTHCHFYNTTVCRAGCSDFPEPTIISSSIIHLSIIGLDYPSLSLALLFERTPNLQYLSISCSRGGPNKFLTSPILSITSLNISLPAMYSALLIEILRWMPNLYRLKVSCGVNLDGNKWEEIISNYLPKLKIFHLREKSYWTNEKFTEENIDKLLNTFRSTFWLDEHRWFVQCNWSRTQGICFLYTLPYTFDDFDIIGSFQQKSTCPQEIKNGHSTYLA